MDKGLTRFMKGRTRIAIVMMVCLVAVLALPAFAHAESWVSEHPAPGSTTYTQPTPIGVDVFGASVKANTGSISVDGIAHKATVVIGSDSGHWSPTEILTPSGLYKTIWTWVAGTGGPTRATLAYYPAATLAPGLHTVTATVKTTAGATLTDPHSWTFTIAAQVIVTPPTPPTPFDNTTCTSNNTCHIHSSAYITDVAMGPKCTQCHTTGFMPMHGLTPSKSSMGTAHDALQAYIIASPSAPCASCHGANVMGVASVNAGVYTVPNVGGTTEHNNCSCHLYGEAESLKACADCHNGPYGAIHGWAMATGPYNSTAFTASGHNTTTYGTVGAHEKWDGSEGVVVKDSTNTTISQEWSLPTASVFWSQSKALNLDGTVNGAGVYSLNPTDSPTVAMANRGGTGMDTAINRTVGWNSVITCDDCHTGLTAAGPQGAAQINVGLDPNFPDDWTKAEITSFDPTGMRSIATTIGTANPYYAKLGGNVYMPAEITSGGVAVDDQGAAIVGLSIETTTQKVWGAPSPSVAPTLPGYSATATKTVYPGGFYGLTNIPSTGYSAGTATGRFICQKCHKLTNSFQGLSIEGNGRGFRDNNLNYMGMSNEAHMEHHNDLVTGQGNCVSCHIAIPHGWKRPRLLVYESDPAPYKVQQFFPNFATNPAADDLNADLSNGNWGFQGWNGTGSRPSSHYIATSTVNAFTGGPASTHLEKLSASASSYKELEVGAIPEDFGGHYDVQNGTAWGKWLMSAEGVAWPGDKVAPAAKINLSGWDLGTNRAVTIVNGDSPIQNNCNACTSAAAGTHAPQNGTNTGGEGVNDAVPYWK